MQLIADAVSLLSHGTCSGSSSGPATCGSAVRHLGAASTYALSGRSSVRTVGYFIRASSPKAYDAGQGGRPVRRGRAYRLERASDRVRLPVRRPTARTPVSSTPSRTRCRLDAGMGRSCEEGEPALHLSTTACSSPITRPSDATTSVGAIAGACAIGGAAYEGLRRRSSAYRPILVDPLRADLRGSEASDYGSLPHRRAGRRPPCPERAPEVVEVIVHRHLRRLDTGLGSTEPRLVEQLPRRGAERAGWRRPR